MLITSQVDLAQTPFWIQPMIFAWQLRAVFFFHQAMSIAILIAEHADFGPIDGLL
jgi:hypothetical protein